jgi:ADP-ribose pyrophosphatase YjhB (NUDIX family)
VTVPTHIVCVTGAVRDPAGRILLVRNDRGWEMPGGQVEVGEAPREALRREVKEEAGCDIEVGRLFGVYSNVTLGLLILAFECSFVGGRVRAGMECTDAGWYEADEAAKLAGAGPAADRIRDSVAASSAVIFRSYERDASGSFIAVRDVPSARGTGSPGVDRPEPPP